MFAHWHIPAPSGIVLPAPTLSRILITRGVLAVIFGLVALLWPAVTAVALALLFGVYAFLNGIALIVEAFRHRKWSHRVPAVIGGLVGVAAGVIAALWPGITIVALALVVGAWAVVTGLFEIVAALKLRKHIRGEAILVAAGTFTALVGVLILLWPFAGALGIAVAVGVYALIYGTTLIAHGYRLRKLVSQLER